MIRSESVENLFSEPFSYHLEIHQIFPVLLNDFHLADSEAIEFSQAIFFN